MLILPDRVRTREGNAACLLYSSHSQLYSTFVSSVVVVASPGAMLLPLPRSPQCRRFGRMRRLVLHGSTWPQRSPIRWSSSPLVSTSHPYCDSSGRRGLRSEGSFGEQIIQGMALFSWRSLLVLLPTGLLPTKQPHKSFLNRCVFATVHLRPALLCDESRLYSAAIRILPSPLLSLFGPRSMLAIVRLLTYSPLPFLYRFIAFLCNRHVFVAPLRLPPAGCDPQCRYPRSCCLLFRHCGPTLGLCLARTLDPTCLPRWLHAF